MKNMTSRQSAETREQVVPGAQDGDIRVDGFAQVLAMLKIADPAFRESILERLAARDRDLARSLRDAL